MDKSNFSQRERERERGRERGCEGKKKVLFGSFVLGLGFSVSVWILRFHGHPITFILFSIFLYKFFFVVIF